MARIEQRSSQLVIVADSDEERALVRHGQQRGGWIVLLESNYPTSDDVVGLPQGASIALAAKVHAAFESAARAHAVAEAQRRRFHLVDP